VYKFFRKRLLQKRLIALAAAYAIALAGLLANFTGAQMAVAAAAQPGGIICHTVLAGGPAPSPDGNQTDGNKTCICNCCIGCLMLSAALPEPPATANAVPQAASKRIALPAAVIFVAGPQTKSHRSRAPPQNA
jgi:hypothetical protein